MNKISNTNVSNNGMKLECIMKVSRPAGVAWLGYASPVVIKLLSQKVVVTK